MEAEEVVVLVEVAVEAVVFAEEVLLGVVEVHLGVVDVGVVSGEGAGFREILCKMLFASVILLG